MASESYEEDQVVARFRLFVVYGKPWVALGFMIQSRHLVGILMIG